MTNEEYKKQVDEIKSILKITDENHIQQIMANRVVKEIEAKTNKQYYV